MLKPLPVGISTFRDIIEGQFLYVDKTREIYELVRYPKGVYFLSRPRRFGKSLLISTLKEIFEGRRELFAGLWIYESAYRWEEYPVIRIDFSQLKVATAAELEQGLMEYLDRIAQQHHVELRGSAYYLRFSDLIRQLAEKGKVVVLIDEYDKPLVDNLQNVEEARRIREVLRGFYTILKGLDEYLRFVLLTGVSKFSKVGVFSGLNNLDDITMSPLFATLLGITEAELRSYFADYLQSLSAERKLSSEELLQQVRHWYDGFCFAADCQPVYNPFSLLKFFKHRRFANYWFETGTPTFLVNLIREQEYDIQLMEELVVDELAFSSYEIGNLSVIPLLFQTGYLTIQSYEPAARLYKLYYPNYEVENAFSRYLLSSFVTVESGLTGGYLWRLAEALHARDFDTFFEVLRIFLADIPYDIQLPRERYYQTIFYLLFK
ncbi:MAG: AAA family ATPase, partial [Anaerolineae bacterium]|nr:AAA family ATPase [Anaerolineae bacterium]